MASRLAAPLLLLGVATRCEEGPPGQGRRPMLDEWQVVAEQADIGELSLLVIGGQPIADNYANRGDVEVHFDPAQTGVRIEMQRFTIADSPELAEAAFERLHYWGGAEPPTGIAGDEGLPCFTPGSATCHVRVHHDALTQPAHDGANFRVTLPAGWTESSRSSRPTTSPRASTSTPIAAMSRSGVSRGR